MTISIDLKVPAAITAALSDNSEEMSALARVDIAVQQLASGGAVLLVDDVREPTLGDIVFNAVDAVTSSMAFAIRHGSGFVQVVLPEDRCRELNLVPQAGVDHDGSTQCVTVDGVGLGTGISAADRAATARLLASADTVQNAFTRPGHMVPLRARSGVGLIGFGTAEASILLTARAGAGSAAVVTGVVSTEHPTEMASGSELFRFSSSHGLPMIGLRDMAIVRPVTVAFEQTVELPRCDGTLVSFSDGGDTFLCLIVGELSGSAVPVFAVPSQQILCDPSPAAPIPRVHVATDTPCSSNTAARTLESLLIDPTGPVRRMLRTVAHRSIDNSIHDSRSRRRV